MKTQIVILEDVAQIILVPESDFDRNVINTINSRKLSMAVIEYADVVPVHYEINNYGRVSNVGAKESLVICFGKSKTE